MQIVIETCTILYMVILNISMTEKADHVGNTVIVQIKISS